jgi:hypothetical protein
VPSNSEEAKDNIGEGKECKDSTSEQVKKEGITNKSRRV